MKKIILLIFNFTLINTYSQYPGWIYQYMSYDDLYQNKVRQIKQINVFHCLDSAQMSGLYYGRVEETDSGITYSDTLGQRWFVDIQGRITFTEFYGLTLDGKSLGSIRKLYYLYNSSGEFNHAVVEHFMFKESTLIGDTVAVNSNDFWTDKFIEMSRNDTLLLMYNIDSMTGDTTSVFAKNRRNNKPCFNEYYLPVKSRCEYFYNDSNLLIELREYYPNEVRKSFLFEYTYWNE